MTNEELAKRWNVSLQEVESISKFMNDTYYLCVGQNKTDKLFYGLMFEIDTKQRHRLVISTKQGFNTSKEAENFMNNSVDAMQMPEGRASLMGVPADAYKTLRKLGQEAPETPNKEKSLDVQACALAKHYSGR